MLLGKEGVCGRPLFFAFRRAFTGKKERKHL